jgi:cell division transport system permease protein
MGAFFLIAFNARKISNDFKEKIPITIYFKNSAKKIETVQLQKKINLLIMSQRKKAQKY